jgi:hypothetical protein
VWPRWAGHLARIHFRFWWGSENEKYYYEEIHVDWKIILKWLVEE